MAEVMGTLSGGPLRVGIAGLGKVAERHAAAVARVPGLKLACLFDHHEASLDAFRRRFPAENVEIDFAAFLGAVDCVAICLPSHLHGDYATRCAIAGKPFLVEKPLDIHVSPARNLVALCERRQLVSGVVSQHRYCPSLAYGHELISSGALGDIVEVRATVQWYRPDDYYAASVWRGRYEFEPGGVLINQAVHAFDILRWWLGKPKWIGATGSNSRPEVISTIDTALCQWKMKGTNVTLECSTAEEPDLPESYVVVGSGGRFEIEAGRFVDLKIKRVQLPLPPIGCGDGVERFELMYRNWLAALQGDGALLCDLQAGLETLEMIDMARESIETKRGDRG